MHLSRYAKIFPSRRGDDAVVLFSTAKVSAVLVPADLVRDIERGKLSPAERECLSSAGLLTGDRAQEKREMLGYLRAVNAANTSLRLIVVLNLDCNLGCRYCFEGGRKGKWYLSGETARGLAPFIQRLDPAGRKDIRITFYGGEPLLSTKAIVAISSRLAAYAAERGLRYEFGLVTNGTLLDAKAVRELVPYGLKSVKVTLDGPERIHNEFRPFRSGRGSFDVIVRNMREVRELVRIQLGGNFTRERYRDFPALLDHLRDRGLTPEKIPLVKFDPVMQESSEFGPRDFNDGCSSASEPWISEATLFLRKEILKRGYRTQRVMPSPCLLHLEDSYVVNYDGRLYKCPGLIGREQCCAGDIAAGPREYARSHGLDDWKNDECLECSYLPLCFGGCKYMHLLKTGTMQGINCQKEYFDRTLGGLVYQDLEYDL